MGLPEIESDRLGDRSRLSDRPCQADGRQRQHDGIGFDLRVSSNVALQPEVTFLRGLTIGGYPQTILYMIGVGINFGAMPNYDDVGGGPPPAF